MKLFKHKSICAVFLMLSLLVAFPTTADDAIPSVFLNGRQVTFVENQPMIINGRTMIPLREMFNIFDFQVSYHDATRTIRLENDRMKVFLRIDDARFFIEKNGMLSHRDLDSPPILKDARTYVPLRAIAEVLGAAVNWDAQSFSVLIYLVN